MAVEWLDDKRHPDRQPVRELKDSVFLLVLTVSSLGAYIGLGALLVRLFAAR